MTSDVPRTAQAIMDLLLFPNRSREWLRENIEATLAEVYRDGYYAGYDAAREKLFACLDALEAEENDVGQGATTLANADSPGEKKR